jgi:hypothetical protein
LSLFCAVLVFLCSEKIDLSSVYGGVDPVSIFLLPVPGLAREQSVSGHVFLTAATHIDFSWAGLLHLTESVAVKAVSLVREWIMPRVITDFSVRLARALTVFTARILFPCCIWSRIRLVFIFVFLCSPILRWPRPWNRLRASANLSCCWVSQRPAPFSASRSTRARVLQISVLDFLSTQSRSFLLESPERAGFASVEVCCCSCQRWSIPAVCVARLYEDSVM